MAKGSTRVLPEGNGGAGEKEEGVPVVSCLEGEKEERDQETLAETSHKAIWRPFYSSAPNSVELQLHLFCQPHQARFPSRGPRNHFCMEGG